MAQYQTLVDLIERSITLHASRPALGTKRADGFAFISYAELGERIARMRAGLAQASVGPGDRVALIADNREEWVVVAAATYGLGAQLVPMYQASCRVTGSTSWPTPAPRSCSRRTTPSSRS